MRDDSSNGNFDLSSLNNYANIFLRIDSGSDAAGFIFMLSCGSGVYEQHSGLLKSYRGHNALRAGREALRWMFLNTDCTTIATWSWSNAKHVMMMARLLRFSEEGRTTWPNKVNGASVDRVIFSQTISEWARRAKDDFVEESLRLNLGVEPEMIGYDAMAVCMAFAGQIEKAQSFYNRMAGIFRAQPIQILLSRAGGITTMVRNRIVEIYPDFSVFVIQTDSLCPSQPHSLP